MQHRCPFCKRNYMTEGGLINHMESKHEDDLYGLPAKQVYFNSRNRYPLHKKYGKCVMTGKNTDFNMVTGRYERFADEKAVKKYREYFRRNMIRKYGKDTLLDEPDHQKKMLANRSISGEYKWMDNSITPYTGSYERKFLEFLDNEVEWINPTDIVGPAPMTFPYIDPEGVERFHIPDFYIGSSNLIVNIKASDNKHYRLRDIEDERAQDEAIRKSKFNYLKLFDNDFDKFLEIIDLIKDSNSNKRIFILK